MNKLATYDFSPLYRNSIGLDRLMSHMINRIDSGSPQTYPPYNIVKETDDKYVIEVAVAGFTEGDISVTVQDGMLVITGEKVLSEEEGETEMDKEYIHQGIGFRKFTRSFDLADYIEVINAVVEHGILKVELERIVPEAMKPKPLPV